MGNCSHGFLTDLKNNVEWGIIKYVKQMNAYKEDFKQWCQIEK